MFHKLYNPFSKLSKQCRILGQSYVHVQHILGNGEYCYIQGLDKKKMSVVHAVSKVHSFYVGRKRNALG